jgi:hypothetical protein
MEKKENLVESLVESVFDYSKSGYDLVKLKTVDKTADVLSSLIPHSIVFVILTMFTLFFNLGLAFWLGEIFGNFFYGFFVVAGFYGITGIFIHVFMHKWLKNKICNYLVKQLLK